MDTRPPLDRDVCIRAVNARDPHFDGILFVGIVTTGIYCRPICPSRRAHNRHRRFFPSAAAAERSGFRPCLRCRPELAPGGSPSDAVSRLARTAVRRISAGALNGRSVSQLARELHVSTRHLRRVLQREIGVSPVELAQTHRLLLARHLLGETDLSVTQVAYAAGFQSLRRFNALFRQRYGICPSAIRRNHPVAVNRAAMPSDSEPSAASAQDFIRLTLAYRPPLAWDAQLTLLRRDLLPGVECVRGLRYARTVHLDGRSGVVYVQNAPASPHLDVDISISLLPVLMPVLARLRQLFDLDAQPAAVDACLARGNLRPLVRRRPGVRTPGAFDGFEIVLQTLIDDPSRSREQVNETLRRIVDEIGEPIGTGDAMLNRLAPTPERVAKAGAERIRELGVPACCAHAIVDAARRILDGRLVLEPGGDLFAARRALQELNGLDARRLSLIEMRALQWPDAFPVTDCTIQRAAGVSTPDELCALAERWRPWRAYAAVHLWLQDSPNLSKATGQADR